MEGRERAVTMAAPTPSPPPEFPREKPRGSREQRQPSVGLRLCKEMWAIEREEREGLEERQLCQQQGRCSGMDLTRGVWKKNSDIPDIRQFLFLQDIGGFVRFRLRVRVRIFIRRFWSWNGFELMTNFLVHPCLHKIIVQPLAVFRQSPSPFTSFEGMEHCRVTLDERGTKTTRGNSRRESVRESEGSPSLFGSQRPFDFSVD